MVLEESSTYVSCLHKQSPFLFGLRSNYFSIRSSHPGPRRYRPISRPIFLIVRFHSFIHSFNIIQFIKAMQEAIPYPVNSRPTVIDKNRPINRAEFNARSKEYKAFDFIVI